MNGSKKTTAGRKAGWLIGGVLAIVLIGGAALLYANQGGPAHRLAAKNDLSRFAVGHLAALEIPQTPEPATAYVFQDADGKDVRFADFKGKVTVVNLWAMWCVPCRTEMPTLQTLAAAYAGTDAVVVPIDVDNTPEGIAEARKFIADHPPLPFYGDVKFQLPFEFKGKGKMPQTILLDRQGRVRATYAGGADWSSPEAKALIDALLAED